MLTDDASCGLLGGVHCASSLLLHRPQNLCRPLLGALQGGPSLALALLIALSGTLGSGLQDYEITVRVGDERAWPTIS